MNEFKEKLQKEYREFKKATINGKLENYYKVYDSKSNVLGKINTKFEKIQGQWLKGISVFPITEDGKIIFEKRANTKVTPNEVDICSGHVDNEENSIQSAYREMEEELGINSENIELLQEIGNEIPLIFTGNRKFFIQFYMAIVKKSHIDKQDKEVEEIFTKELKEGFELIRQ